MIKVSSRNYKYMSDMYWEKLANGEDIEEVLNAITKYQFSCVYNECKKSLDYNRNQFTYLLRACSHYAKNVVENLEVGQESYVMSRNDTYSGKPIIIYF